MKNKFIFLSPMLLSRLEFSEPTPGDYYVKGLKTERPRKALPEEIVRQLLVLSLVHHYRYPEANIRIEYPIQMGRTKKRADVAVLGDFGEVQIIIETKQFIEKDSVAQLESYLQATGASFGLVVSPLEFHCLRRDGNSLFVKVDDIPIFGSSPNDARHAVPTNQSSSIDLLRGALNIESFEKVGDSNVRVVVQGQTIQLKFVELSSYAKFRKRLLASGVVLVVHHVGNSEWLLLVRELLNSAPTAPAAGAVNAHRIAKESVAAWLTLQQSREETKIRFVTALQVFISALQGKDRDFGRREAQEIASIMRNLGWEKCHGRLEGTLRNGWRPPLRESKTTSKKSWASQL